jgi:UDP-N-acetylmuramoyl-L-alanyl-D-glutamate--2,6-diaminopimelate ligase
VKLAKLPKILPGIHLSVPEEIAEVEVTGIAHDSRRIKPGWVFVAIPGHQRDGCDFIQDALSRGAVAIVSERPVRMEQRVPQFIVQDARRALAALANTYYGKPSRRMQVVGITGTNGKTTTSYMVRSILAHAGQRCGLLGTINYDTGRRQLQASITTPESVDIQEFLAEMVAEGMDSAVMEVSSHSLCMRRVDFVQFAVGVFTNLSPEHMDYHRTLTSYRDAKTRLFRGLGPASLAVLNADDKTSEHIARSTFAKVVWYGLKNHADVSAKVRKSGIDGTQMTLRCSAGEADISLPLIGIHNVSNALAAASVAMALGHDLALIREGLERMPIIPGRLEPVPCEKGCKVLVDFAHTDQALKSVLKSLRQVGGKRIIVVFGAGGDRDKTKRPRMGRVAEQYADLAWVTSDNPRGEEPMAIIEEILSGMKGRSRVRVQPDRQAAITEALQCAGPGDVVLIAGKGHERTQRFRDTVIPFDDREAVTRAVTVS